jgi:hypothetical protein
VTREMGGTRFVPGTHLRRVSEVALGRYQNIAGQQHMVCEAGTLLFLHKKSPQPQTVESILMTPEPWFEQDTGRLEFLNRIKLWRHLAGDPAFDADHWATRLENPARKASR